MAAPMKLDLVHTGVGCNRCPFSADWGKNGLICYGYQKAIALYQPETISAGQKRGVISTICGHSGKVNCVRWIPDIIKGEREVISGSCDGTAIIWSTLDDQFEEEPACTLKGHDASVTCVVALYLPNKGSDENNERQTLVVTASVDSTVRIWKRKGKDVEENQVLDFGSGFALALALCIVPNAEVPILACGCDDHKIHLYVQEKSEKFEKVISLTGHDDWIRDLNFTIDDNSDVLLASCAQDNLIRVWRMSHRASGENVNSAKSISDLSPEEDITMKETVFTFKNKEKESMYAVSLESVLWGHENRVYSVRWQPASISEDGKYHQPMKLLSASMDKTMILWSPDPESGVWVEQVRVGDVGGNTLGFFGGLFSSCGQSILAHGYQGAFSQWSLNQTTGVWEPQVTGGGHFDSVTDLAWSGSEGNFVLTTSIDQTTRLHAPWIRKDIQPTWYEIARPQVHGYDLNTLAILGTYSFASGAEEKLVRVFTAPRNFVTNFCQTCGHDAEKELSREENAKLPEGANVPALGLSNKAVFSETGLRDNKEEPHKMGQYPENYFTAVSLSAPPTEDHLLQNTLWPEDAKLYGHGYEIYSLAAHPSGKLLASACKAAKADAANIFLWDIETKRQVASLSGCTLTVTQMAFSHTGTLLLAVSRDRSWALYQQSDTGQYVLKAYVDKKTSAHRRVIWSCCWSHDDKYFFTASRDQKVMVWNVESVLSAGTDKSQVPHITQGLPDSVTAVCVAPVQLAKNRYLIAAGLENGQISLHTWSPSGEGSSGNWTSLITLTSRYAHHLTVTRLAFRPRTGRVGFRDGADSQWLQLASSSEDHAVRVYDINLASL